MADPKAEAEKRKRESEKKALDREKLTLAQGKEKLKLSQIVMLISNKVLEHSKLLQHTTLTILISVKDII